MGQTTFYYVAATLPEHGAALKDWPGETLVAGRAVTASIAAADAAAADTRIAEVWPGMDDAKVDCYRLDAPPSKKRLLIADMESTIIAQEMLDELADAVGLREQVEAITASAMRGELDFESAINERVALLKGLDASVLDQMATDRMTYMPGARELVASMKAAGAYCALVSGGFTHFTAIVARELGFDEHRANTLEIADGKLTGRVVPPILGREAKLQALEELTAQHGFDVGDAIAVGDGANDLAMLKAAGLGVAFRAKPAVRDAMAAHKRGVVVNHCDLTALLYVQSYIEADIRTGS
ncbi:MAG: phosphoserine phosphatase SerB [Pseudomonadota bacterium]